VFWTDIRRNSKHFRTQHKLTGFHNGDGECSLRGTDQSLNKPEVNGSAGGPLLRRLKFDPGPVYVRFVVDGRVLSFSPLKVNDDN